jgi:hypothetical protein
MPDPLAVGCDSTNPIPHSDITAVYAQIPATRAAIVRVLLMVQQIRETNWGSRVVDISRDGFGPSMKMPENPGDYLWIMNGNTARKYPHRLTSKWYNISFVIESLKYEIIPGDSLSNAQLQSAWPDGMILLAYCPKSESERDKSTIQFKFGECVTVEIMSDRDNNRCVGRVIDDYEIEINPEMGYLVMGA